ncbi:MucB/RseB C-terminal domain-containing protein [Thiorhodococcus minor]|uniref:Transcriptional regulator n=1 Tax=Thiorhodococcus minor TaxID=57489 RepID=A0A6M0JY19_9GAMM|nr:MucB/RseB C-terminal domain-containing protein [Thiorhodococcus minor]NEV62392.1 transcriptional regulator [Thiorhodococcus minor]
MSLGDSRRVWVAGLLVILCWTCAIASAVASEGEAPHSAGEDAQTGRSAELLARMAEAVRSLDYEGTLVYLHENRLEAMDLRHQVVDGEVHERLISLSGPIRAVVRAQERVMCVMPNGHPISVEQNGQSRFLETEGIDPDALVDNYEVRMLGAARIAGRDTDVVGIIPRDALRYGYRFHIDRETALPLKSDLIDQEQQPLEQLMFTSVAVRSPEGPAPESSGQPVRSAPATSAEGRWRFLEVPAGFELVMHDEMKQPGGSIIEHFMFTDRLSAYSIYIDQDMENGLEGAASIGAVHAAGRSLRGYQLIAVGEVPMQTVQQAVGGVRLKDAADSQ